MLPRFPSKLSLASLPSPLRPLSRLSAHIGGPRIWLKSDDLSGSTLSGNKVRKLEFTLAAALEAGCDTLITCGGLQSNHCRATAILAARLGLKVHLILRGDPPDHLDGNHLLDALVGAQISIYPAKQYHHELDALFEHWQQHYQNLGSKVWCVPTGASDGWGLWGYLNASIELQNDFERHGIEPEYVICATGSGGTQAGLSLGFALQQTSTQVLGMAVCDDAAYFKNKAEHDIREWAALLDRDDYARCAPAFENLNVQTNDAYIGPGYARAYPEALETIKLLARLEGEILDPVYTSKAFYGMLNEIKKGSFEHCSDLVFVHTGGIFGVFPFRDELQRTLNQNALFTGVENA